MAGALLAFWALLPGTAPAPTPVPAARVASKSSAPSPRARAAEAATRNFSVALDRAGAITDPTTKALALSAIAAAKAQVGDLAGAKRIFDQVNAMAAKIEPSSREAWVFVLVPTAEAQGKAGYLVGARAAVARINDPNFKVFALTPLMVSQAKRGDAAAARQLRAQAEAAAATIKEDYFQLKAVLMIAAASAKLGDMAEARQLCEQAKALALAMKDESPKALALGEVVDIQARAVGDLAGAEATAALIPETLNKGMALSSIAEALVKTKETTAAKLVIDSGRAAAAHVIDRDFQAWTLARLATAQATAGDPLGAATSAAAIADDLVKAMCLAVIAAQQAKSGDAAGAKPVMSEATAIATAIPDAARKAELLGKVGLWQAKMGDLTGATATAEAVAAIPSSGTPRVQSEKDEALGAIAAAQAKAGDSAGARASAALIEDTARQAKHFCAIALATAWAEDIISAEKWAGALGDPAARCYSHLGVAEAAGAMAQGKTKPDLEEE